MSEKDQKELKQLCRKLLRCGRMRTEPHYIVQPFVSTVVKHATLINKYKL